MLRTGRSARKKNAIQAKVPGVEETAKQQANMIMAIEKRMILKKRKMI